ncbi:MAG: DUF6488 family protein [Gammaproteobacteria bacterium]|nr:DUF6488 family protein [Gammaproteobacteria bacterium]
MKSGQIILLLIFSLFLIQPVFAGPGHADHTHSHDVDAAGAQKAALSVLNTLVNRNKIDSSWKDAKPGNAEKKTVGANTEWLVTFNNAQEKDPAKSTLYIFLTTEGKYVAANFTGK